MTLQRSDISVINQKMLLDPDPVKLAQWLLHKYLVSTIDDKVIISRITETEAYKAPEDKACHAYNNKLTKRTATMFESGGIAYVYLCYGIHDMFNVVTGPKGSAHAILIRAIELIEGLDHVKERRGQHNASQLTDGPGKVCKALGITRKHNALYLCDKDSEIFLGMHPTLDKKHILAGPRVGIEYAEECKDWPWRFRVKG